MPLVSTHLDGVRAKVLPGKKLKVNKAECVLYEIDSDVVSKSLNCF